MVQPENFGLGHTQGYAYKGHGTNEKGSGRARGQRTGQGLQILRNLPKTFDFDETQNRFSSSKWP